MNVLQLLTQNNSLKLHSKTITKHKHVSCLLDSDSEFEDREEDDDDDDFYNEVEDIYDAPSLHPNIQQDGVITKQYDVIVPPPPPQEADQG